LFLAWIYKKDFHNLVLKLVSQSEVTAVNVKNTYMGKWLHEFMYVAALRTETISVFSIV
jgi:hypothetical protein